MRPLIAKLLNFLSWLQLLGWLAFLWFIEKAETLTGLQRGCLPSEQG